ncbi:hypothetical protein [Rhodococcus aetherivorans]|uniref:hypothetical protein n=1 Tax=Rhodococcus aetherivorans TaxID=191292 RepID=UPI0016398F14|nr:hypothetical protein [Rhodococcus aetherivorans]MBC2590759.1 hypothetical protein [Rhodococcus aetherivorans]
MRPHTCASALGSMPPIGPGFDGLTLTIFVVVGICGLIAPILAVVGDRGAPTFDKHSAWMLASGLTAHTLAEAGLTLAL